MPGITNHELHIMLTKINGKVDLLLVKEADNKEWQDKHEVQDLERFDKIDQNVQTLTRKVWKMNGLVAAFAAFAAFFGANLDGIITYLKVVYGLE